MPTGASGALHSDLAAVPYCGVPAVPLDLWSRWNFDPVLLLGLALLMVAHARLTMQRESPAGGRRLVPFAAAWSLVFILFVSPVCALASALFSVRVLHHMVLVAIVPPLLLMAAPSLGRRLPATPLWLVVFALLHAVILWFWHAPAPYAAALAQTSVYWLMQASLFASALLVWTGALARGTPGILSLALLLATIIQTGLLGALITFARTPLYAFHLATTQVWGLSPLADQQLAGLIMWVPGALPYLAAALAILFAKVLQPGLQPGASPAARA